MTDDSTLPARESMQYDVVIVGAGPAGLAAAIRLKSLDPNISVVIVEKGLTVGAHILSGAVIDPIGLDRLTPDWRSDSQCPLKTQVVADQFYFLTETKGARLPSWAMPRLMGNHGNFIGSLGASPAGSGRAPRRSGSRSIPGLRRRSSCTATKARWLGSRPVIWASAGTVIRRRALRGGWNCSANTCCLRREPADRCRSRQSLVTASIPQSEPQKYGIGLKELWQVAEDRFSPGLVQHTFGWPLSKGASGGSFLYHYGDRLVSVGFVVHLNYQNPTLSPFDEFQRFKTHPLMRATLCRGQADSLRRARHRLGWLAVRPEIGLSRGGLHWLFGGIREFCPNKGVP